MSGPPTTGSPPPQIDRDVERQLREMNEALIVSSVRQNELAELARRAEAACRDSEVRYRRLFQSSRDGVLILDASTGKVIDANAFASGLLGREPDDILGRELYEIGIFKDEEANRAAFEGLHQHGYIRFDDMQVKKPSGETTHVEFVSNAYMEGDRKVAQCTVRDISVRARLEQQVRRQFEAMAEQARRKDEFLAMLSHELRNPLAPIRAAVYLLKLHDYGSENLIQKQAREVIERQVGNLTKLVGDLLDVSRVVSGRIRLDKCILDMNQVLRHALETAKSLIEHRGHELSVNLGPDPVWVEADATRLEQVFVNLLNNAAKYTDKGGWIEVGCERNGDRVLVRVRDNGVGISSNLLEGGRIFDLFTQADRTLDRSQGGLGIGLSLAHRLVAMHGGTIEAHSAGPGQGSEFIVQLPIALAAGPAPAPPPAPVHEHEMHSLRVLVVDDNVDGCEMHANLLRQQGYGVQVAHTGPAALATARSWRPDVMLLDIGLPEIDGYEVARRLRADPMTRNIKLVAVSGYGTEKDLQLGREAGFDAHLLKPVDHDAVDKLLVAWAEARSLEQG